MNRANQKKSLINRLSKKWIRKFHIYLGLYFLLFIWLFSFSGLLLNNPEWSISNYWPDREESSFQKEIIPPAETGDLAIARDVMHQLELRGEIYQTRWGSTDGEFGFQVRRPGHIFNIDVNLKYGYADLTEIRVNTWGVIRMLHTFTGAKNQTEVKRNWFLTKIWSFSIDAVAVGLIILVLSGIYMWFCLEKKRIQGVIILILGTASCWFFLFGITVFF